MKLHLGHWYVMEMHSNVEIILDHSFLCHYSLVEATSSWTDHHPLIKSNKKEKIELLLVVTAEDFNELYLVITSTCTFVIGYHPHTNQNTKATKMWQQKCGNTNDLMRRLLQFSSAEQHFGIEKIVLFANKNTDRKYIRCFVATQTTSSWGLGPLKSTHFEQSMKFSSKIC